MQRRKFLVGMGSLAAGSAAAMGTGAISSTDAERSFTIRTSKDTTAYIGLATPNDSVGYAPTNNNGAYTKGGNDYIGFAFTDSNGTVTGEGPNLNAVTNVLGIIGVQNQGSQELEFYFEKSAPGIGSSFDDRVGLFAVRGQNTGQPSHIAQGNDITGSGNALKLATGEMAVVSLQVDTTHGGTNVLNNSVTRQIAGGSFDARPSDDDRLLREVIVHADAT